MPSRLDRNLRKGHLAEDIGINVLRSFSAVADVRHQDDVGVDAFCLLLQPEGRMFLAEDPFSVQFKTASQSKIEYEEYAIPWFVGLQTPLFFARVDASSGIVAFYTASRYREALFHADDFKSIILDFESEVSGKIENDTLVAGMSPPFLECDELYARTDEFAEYAFSHFKEWIAFERKSIELQKFNVQISAKWESGGVPELFFMGSKHERSERKPHLTEALPIVKKLAGHAIGIEECDPTLLNAFLRIFAWYENEGFDQDDLDIDILEHVKQNWASS